MGLTQEIEQALSRPFDAAKQGLDPVEYQGLGVWHNGPTIEESWIKISRELNTESGSFVNGIWTPAYDPTAPTDIDILDETGVKGTGKGELKDVNKLKTKFNNLRKQLPPGQYGMNADHPTKGRMYLRTWLNDRHFRLSGSKARGKLTAEQELKLTKKGIPLKFDTMIMTVHPKGSKVDLNGLRDPLPEDIEYGLPKSEADMIARGIIVMEDPDTGKQWKYRARSKTARGKVVNIDGNEFKFERNDWAKRQSGHRVHNQKMRGIESGKSLSKQDYIDYAQQNGLPTSLAEEKFNKNQLRLKSRQLRSGKGTPWIIEHLNPKANPESGVEHWRNNILWTEDINQAKSDIIPSPEALRKAGVPLTKAEALALDFADDPGVPTKQARGIILGDLENQLKNGNTVRARNLRKVGRAFSGAEAAARFASGDFIGGSIGAAMQTPAFQKAIAKTLAKSGAKIAPGVGIGLSTLEAAGYASQGRWTQSGIATLSGLVGEVPLVGDAVSAGLDLANTGIDIATGNIGQPDVDEDELLRKVGRTSRQLSLF